MTKASLILALILCAGLLVWGIVQLAKPEETVRRKYPDAETVPPLMIRRTRLRGFACGGVGVAGVIYCIVTLLA